MTNKKSTIYFGVFGVILLFVFTLIKTLNYKKETEVNHTPLIKLELNTIITNVAIGRQVEIKVKEDDEWLRVGGSKLNLEKNQKEPKEYYLKGDSIIKAANSKFFVTKRGDQKFNWTIE